jgi:O-antigen/teichoic acid export membrane protein
MSNRQSLSQMLGLEASGSGTITGRLHSLLTARYQASIVRRVAVLLLFIGPAFLANLLVYYFTARILTPTNFGLFYVAVTIGNVAFSGSLVLNIFFTRYLVQINAKPEGDVVAGTRRIQRVVGFWGAILSIAACALLIMLSKSVGAQSSPVVLLIVADTYAAYLADIGRAFLQARRETWRLGCYSLFWMILRLLLCVLASLMFGTVWAALLGSTLSSFIIFGGLQLILMRSAARRQQAAPPLRFAALFPVALGYGLLMVVSNLDILLVYFLLRGGEIGAYSASSVFPKGILVATTPISQMLFAVMTGDRESTGVFGRAARKTIWVIATLTIAAAIAVWLSSPWICGGVHGLTLCMQSPLHVLLVSAVLLSILRITVLLEFVQQRDWLLLSLIFPTSAYLLVTWYANPGLEDLARQFTIFCGATLGFFIVVQWIAAHWRGAERP